MPYEFPTSLWPIESGDRSASSHLNRLKEHTAAIDFGWWMINRIWDENTTGAISYPPINDDSLKIVATGSPSMQVVVKAGAGFLNGIPFRKTGDTTITALDAPTTEPRIDAIGIDPTNGTVHVYEGDENASPVAPSVPSGIFKAGEVYLRVSSTAIYNSAASTNGYIQTLRALFSLPGDEPHTSGLTVSGGAFIHEGSSGDITLPADGLSIEFDYAGEVNIDATDAAGNLVFRTGGSTDRLTLGIPANPIILHGSSHDLILSANGQTLKSSGPSVFNIEQDGGSGISLVTDGTTRYLLDTDGDHHFVGSLGEVQVRASGNRIDLTRAGANEIRATGAAGTIGFYVLNGSLPCLYLGAAVQILGDDFQYDFYRTSPKLQISGSEQFILDATGDGIAIQTEGVDRYEISASGRHDIYGDAYFHDDVYILGSLFIGGVPVTPGGSPGLSGFGAITLPGTVFEPADSGGSDGPNSAEFGSNVLLFQVFLKDVNTYCCAPNILMPLLYNPDAPVSVRVRWSADDETTDTVRFSLQTAPQGEGDAASATLNTATTIVDANAGTANQMRVTDWTEINMTNIVAGDAFLLRLDRTGTHESDILDDSIRVHSVDIRYFGGTIDE